MFGRYYRRKSYCHLKTLGKLSKCSFLHYYNGAQKHEGFVGFKKAFSRVKPYVILTPLNYVHFYTRYTVDDVNFCDGLECVYVKHQQHVNCLINTWVYAGQTWLLIACDTDFNAIIKVKMSLHLHPHSTLCI